MSKAIITESHLTDIANAIIAKGGADAPLKPSEMAAAIRAINVSEIERRENLLTNTLNLPNLYKILREDNELYPNKIIWLITPTEDSTVLPKLGDMMKTGDGETYTDAVTHVWATKDISKRFIIAYKESGDFTSVPPKSQILAVVGNEQSSVSINFEQATTCLFFDAKGKRTHYRNVKMHYIFSGNTDEIYLNNNQYFHQCDNVIEIPKKLIGMVDNSPSFTARNLSSLPRIFDITVSLNLSYLTSMYDRESLVKFDSNGDIPDTQLSQTVDMGWLNNLVTTSNTGVTITLDSNIKNLFTQEEQEKIALFLTGKNRSLSW